MELLGSYKHLDPSKLARQVILAMHWYLRVPEVTPALLAASYLNLLTFGNAAS